jgi:hypothetical protein
VKSGPALSGDRVGEQADMALYSLLDDIEFNRRLQETPDGVSNEEIQQQFGSDIDPLAIREAFRKNTFGKAPKNPRASARGKFRRRLLWLQRILSDVEGSIEHLLQTPGKIYKLSEIESLKVAIKEFREKSGLHGDGNPEVSELGEDFLERVLASGGASWGSPEAPEPEEAD